MKKLVLFTALALLCHFVSSQHIELKWAAGIGGNGYDQATSTAVDADGNIYITGRFQGTVDFDPSSSTANLSSSAGTWDIFIAKYNASGAYQWAKRMGGSYDDLGYSLSLDGSGNIYVTGFFQYIADFDPSSSTANLASAGNWEIFIAKYDPLGNYLWANSMGGASHDIGYSLSVDGSGNVYVTGIFAGTVDFDPSSATANLTSAGLYDVFIAKYDASGAYLWANRMGGSSYDYGSSLSLDGSGNVYVTGYFQGTADFGLSSSTASLISAGGDDIFIAKYNASGTYLWANRMGGSSGDRGRSLSLDGSGNIYITGEFEGAADFDPSSSTANLTSAGSSDMFISKYDPSGAYFWANKMGGTSTDYSMALCHDGSGNVYVSGYFQSTADFDPSSSTANLASAGSYDAFISKYDDSGAYMWANRMGGSLGDFGRSLSIDGSGNLYVAGWFEGTADFDPSSSTLNLNSAGGYDIFITKYSPIITEVIWNGSSWSATPDGTRDAIVQGDLTLSSDVTVKNMTIESGNDMIVGLGGILRIAGDLTINGTLTVVDGGSVLMSESSSQSGTATVQKQGWTTQKYNYIGSPVANGNTASLGSQIYTYDESQPYGNDRWIAASGSMTPGVGYTSFNTGLASFSGTFNNGTVPVTINRTEAGNDGIEGWNLISNPYPSAISATNFVSSNGNINKNLYFWDESGKTGYEYSNSDYIIYDSQTSTVVNAGNGASFDGWINSCQGFFVQKTANGSGTLNFDNLMSFSGNNSNLLKVAATAVPYVKVQLVSASGQYNELLVKYTEGASAGTDNYDGYHLKGNPDLAFYSKIDGGDYIVNALPPAFPSEVLLGLDAGAADSYTFSLGSAENMENLHIYLEDVQENTFTDLKTTDYTVALDPATDLQRFKLHVREEVVLSSSAPMESNLIVSTAGDKLLINDALSRTKGVMIFDLSGRKVMEFSASGAGRQEYALPLTEGIYIIRISTETEVVSRKVQVVK